MVKVPHGSAQTAAAAQGQEQHPIAACGAVRHVQLQFRGPTTWSQLGYVIWQLTHEKALREMLKVVLWGVLQVVFKLHPSFQQPVRAVDGPSFELTESGWGEFDIAVEVRHTYTQSTNDIAALGLRSVLPWRSVVCVPDPVCSSVCTGTVACVQCTTHAMGLSTDINLSEHTREQHAALC